VPEPLTDEDGDGTQGGGCHDADKSNVHRGKRMLALRPRIVNINPPTSSTTRALSTNVPLFD
jgi:hypothetical protein